MTTKEINDELDEVLNYKLALTNKINHNTREVFKIDGEIIRVTAKIKVESNNLVRKALEEWRKELRSLGTIGRKGLSKQVTERTKLSSERIAKQFNVTKAVVIYRWKEIIRLSL